MKTLHNQKFTSLLLPILVLALAGCGSKEKDASTTEAPPTKSTTDTAGLSSKVVGEWTMSSEQPTAKVDADISIRDDGTFTNAGTIHSHSPGEDGSVEMDISYSIDGKWTVDGDSIATTPDAVEVKVESMDLVAKDPSNQAVMDGQKPDLMKKAEDQAKATLNQKSKSKVVSATPEKLTLQSPEGIQLEYIKKQ